MDEGNDDWKGEVLQDFRRWLEELPQAPLPEAEERSGGGDLRDLFAEFAALRQEVRLQNREQGKAVRELEKAAAAHESLAALARARDEDLAGFESRIRSAAERQCLLAFLEVREALVRGREAGARLKRKQGFFSRPPAGIESVVEGYEMAIRRFDRALAQLGVRLVPTVGCRFDARAMRAVETRQDEQVEDGTVIEELSSGFARGDEVLRPAEVVVNKHSDTGE